jgi:hypothetical protein
MLYSKHMTIKQPYLPANTFALPVFTFGTTFFWKPKDSPAPPPCFVMEKASSLFLAWAFPSTAVLGPNEWARGGSDFGGGGVIGISSSAVARLGEYLQ